MAMILPKGIVVNSDKINESVQKIAREPLDAAEIARFWQVYTTTTRRLQDPTAERLENYWWRIWHSDRQFLPATTIARLYGHISDGPTFVPLRGPPNRDEGPSRPHRSLQPGPGASSTTALRQHPTGGPSAGTTSTTASSSTTSKAQSPMPHPILKKTRGPSASGPRPTARFISPHESEHEPDASSSLSTNSHVVVQPPSPQPTEATPGKKPVGSGSKKRAGFPASKKRRPVIVRRPSSQTSQSSADAAVAAVREAARRKSEASQTAAESPTSFEVAARPPGRAQSKFRENFSLSPVKPSRPKRRASDAKRSASRKSTTGKGRVGPSRVAGGSFADTSGDPGPSTQLRRIENSQRRDSEDLSPRELLEERESSRLVVAKADARRQERPPRPEPSTKPEHLLNKQIRSKSAGNLGLMRSDPKGSPSLAPTLAAATGLVVGSSASRELRRPMTPIPEGNGKGKEAEEAEEEEGSPRSSPAKQPSQVQQSSPVTDALSRSKSQLTLLLLHDKEKTSRNSGKLEGERERRKK